MMTPLQRFAFGSALLLGACAASQQEKDHTSASKHRSEARQHDAEARQERRQYDPSATELRPVPGPASSKIVGVVVPDREYNPTGRHLDNAQAEARHATEHRDEARQLEGFEAVECRGYAGAVRSACPMLGPVIAVTDINHGVRLDYRAGTDLTPVMGLMRCHLAFARTRGYGVASGCPLYLRGVDINLSKDQRSIEFTTDDGPGEVSLRQHSREMVP